MTELYLAQFLADIGDWLETVVILMVIAGSVFGAISKKLIAAFSPKGPRKSDTQMMPEFEKPAGSLKPTVAKPVAPQEPPPFVVVEESSSARRSATGSARRRKKLKVASRTASAQSKSQRTARPAKQAVGHMDSEKRLGRLHSSLEEQEEKFEDLIEEDVGHLITGFDEPGHPSHEWAKGKAASVTGGHVRSRLLVRRTAREAIIVAEILGPPLGMRDPQQNI